MIEALNIYQRINEVRKKVWYVKKNKAVSTGGGSYKAATHDAVTAMIRNHLIDQSVLIVPRLVSSRVEQAGATKAGTPIIRYEAKFDIDFVNCDKPDDVITVSMEAHANDSGDKAPGKAVSYAAKFAILKLFNIETGEDEESRVEPWGGVQLVSEEQAAEIKALLEESDADVTKFLAWANAGTVEQIQAKRYDDIIAKLKTKAAKHD